MSFFDCTVNGGGSGAGGGDNDRVAWMGDGRRCWSMVQSLNSYYIVGQGPCVCVCVYRNSIL